MLALELNQRHKFSGSRGSRVMPIQAWETARPQMKEWIKALKAGRLGKDRCSGPFLSLIKVPDDHPVCVIVGLSDSKVDDLPFCTLHQLPREDRDILERWFSQPVAHTPADVSRV